MRVQTRISANQTAGIGKLGEFTREQMNAIQYGAEAGALGQIAQGNSLRRVFGTGAGFQESYSAMANTQADMQNYTARETTRSAREHFGNSLRGGGSSGISFADAARGNADLKHDQFAGTAQGYNDAMAYAKAEGITGSPFQDLAKTKTSSMGDGRTNALKTAMKKVEGEMGQNLGESYDNDNAGNLENDKKLAGIRATKQVHQELGTAGVTGHKILHTDLSGKSSYDQKIEAKTQELQDSVQDNYDSGKNSFIQSGINNLSSKDKQAMASAMIQQGETDENTKSTMGAVADSDSMRSSGFMNSNGTMTSAGMNAMITNSLQQQHNMMGMNNMFGNTPQQRQALNNLMTDIQMNPLERQSVLSAGSPTERANRFFLYTRNSTLQGTYRGMSFNVNAGADGAYHGKFDSRTSITGGVTADMGEAYSYLAYSADGVKGARNWGTTKTVYNGVMDTIGTVGEVASLVRGGGKLGGIRKAFKGSPSQTGNAGGVVETGVMKTNY